MLQRIMILKHINLTIITLFIGFAGFSQKLKIDGVAVVIGKNIVLNSDIDKFKKEIEKRSEGKIKISDCEMLEELMQQKLLSHHAVVDSVTVTDAEVNEKVNGTIAYFTQEYGSVDKMLKVYGFNGIEDFKSEIYIVEKDNLLIQREQAKITEKVDVTPEEVRLYFNGLKDKGELPEIPAEVEIAQIVLKAIPSKEEDDRIIEKLNELKTQIEEGANFKMKAIINSDDPGVTSNGGQYEVTKDSPFIKEFKEMAFSLDIGQVSKPFKSDFGYHIMQLHEIRGNKRIASHILMRSSVPDQLIKDTKIKAEQVKKDILDSKITFEEAVKQYSQDDETKNDGGLITNPYNGESKFDLTRMDPDLYGRVAELKKGGYTDVFFDQDQSGVKMFKFMLMRERTDTHVADLVQDYVKIQELALMKKKEEVIAKWSKEKIKDTYIKLSEIHNKCTFEKNWKKETAN